MKIKVYSERIYIRWCKRHNGYYKTHCHLGACCNPCKNKIEPERCKKISNYDTNCKFDMRHYTNTRRRANDR